MMELPLFYMLFGFMFNSHPSTVVSEINESIEDTPKFEAFVRANRPWCPYEIQPCSCDGPQSFILLTCDRIVDPYTIPRVSRSFYSAESTRSIGKFILTNSRISTLRHDDLGFLECEYFYARKNTLTTIESGFFNSSRHSLKRIEIVHNDMENFPFKDFSNFPKLEYIDLKYNSIKSIPDDAFGSTANYKLKKLDLSFNKITHIGSHAFKYLCELELLSLEFNKLTVINNYAFAASQPNPKLTLNLSNNKIMIIADGAFDNQVFKCLNLTDNNLGKFPEKIFFAPLKAMAESRSGIIYVTRNRFRCTCENVGWLARLPSLYQSCVIDMKCTDKDNKKLQELSLYDLGCS